MLIGIDIRTLMDARYSGVSEYTLNLIKEILKLDNHNEYRFFYNSFGNCPNVPEFNAKNVKLIKYNYPNKLLNYLLFKFFNYPKIDKELRVDVFFMPHINFIGLSFGSKSLITVHDLSFLRNPKFFSLRKNFWHNMINVSKLLKKFKQIIAISENTKRDIIELCGISPDKIKVIYSGVGEEYKQITNLNLIELKDTECSIGHSVSKAIEAKRLNEVKQKYNLPDNFILYLGTIEPRKNIEGIIKAYNQLRIDNSELEDVKLIIVGGKGWKSKNIYKEWDLSEYKDDIKFLDYISSENKVYLYNLASVFLYPSFYEGFGFPPLEAMACGTPVIASYSSSLPEVIGDAGLLVDPYNITEIANALKQILLNKDLSDKLIKKGLEQAKQFSWIKTAREYLEVFSRLE
ncbi:MAG: glycosyltransferase family 1 protein [Patescibacteria group bacterium]|nr:glycosyltransferase family 4 protein [Patescibacteria group bacterium]MBU0879804.1 glycosyltransferase family 4 protein [Patescibacteria group bacterium]MBU0897815.1 glycosyltransferase family 4 protein [Patescibacteria group bacterium]MBU1063076.1 glycosyltransferase family 4 protein [Patescibacteria group bacterium]MBU1783623.1 glycosyltransferase family 4 protein [Patescibacteria group bacterium]